MSAKFFIDTNILVYSFDHGSPEKRAIAKEIIRDGQSWVISWQVVQEFCNVALHRFAKPMLPADLRDYLRLILMPGCKVMPTAQIYQNATQIQSQTGYRFYDSLIVASALASGVETLYSEDLQADRVIGNLQVRNPFKNA